MGHHFRERESHVLNRRSILKGIAAGTAAMIAKAATAENVFSDSINVVADDILENGKAFPNGTLSDGDQLEACITEIRAILARMHPNVGGRCNHYLHSREDGSYRLIFQGDVKFQTYQGDGIYIVSTDGYLTEYLVREEPVVTLSGMSCGWSHYYGRARAEDGGWDDFERMLPAKFVRKLEV